MGIPRLFQRSIQRAVIRYARYSRGSGGWTNEDAPASFGLGAASDAASILTVQGNPPSIDAVGEEPRIFFNPDASDAARRLANISIDPTGITAEVRDTATGVADVFVDGDRIIVETLQVTDKDLETQFPSRTSVGG